MSIRSACSIPARSYSVPSTPLAMPNGVCVLFVRARRSPTNRLHRATSRYIALTSRQQIVAAFFIAYFFFFFLIISAISTTYFHTLGSRPKSSTPHHRLWRGAHIAPLSCLQRTLYILICATRCHLSQLHVRRNFGFLSLTLNAWRF